MSHTWLLVVPRTRPPRTTNSGASSKPDPPPPKKIGRRMLWVFCHIVEQVPERAPARVPRRLTQGGSAFRIRFWSGSLRVLPEKRFWAGAGAGSGKFRSAFLSKFREGSMEVPAGRCRASSWKAPGRFQGSSAEVLGGCGEGSRAVLAQGLLRVTTV